MVGQCKPENYVNNKHKINLQCVLLLMMYVFCVCVCMLASELKASIDKLTQMLEGMYSDNSLCQVNTTRNSLLNIHFQFTAVEGLAVIR